MNVLAFAINLDLPRGPHGDGLIGACGGVAALAGKVNGAVGEYRSIIAEVRELAALIGQDNCDIETGRQERKMENILFHADMLRVYLTVETEKMKRRDEFEPVVGRFTCLAADMKGLHRRLLNGGFIAPTELDGLSRAFAEAASQLQGRGVELGELGSAILFLSGEFGKLAANLAGAAAHIQPEVIP